MKTKKQKRKKQKFTYSQEMLYKTRTHKSIRSVRVRILHTGIEPVSTLSQSVVLSSKLMEFVVLLDFLNRFPLII